MALSIRRGAGCSRETDSVESPALYRYRSGAERVGYPSEGDVPYEYTELKQTDVWLPAAYTAKQKGDRADFESGTQSADCAMAYLRLKRKLNWRQSKHACSRSTRKCGGVGLSLLGRSLRTIVGPVQKMLWLLLGAVALVLLIAIGNVASLQIARLSGRAHEMGIRTALGAERARIVRQLLTESLLLTCTGGALGIALSYAAVHLLSGESGRDPALRVGLGRWARFAGRRRPFDRSGSHIRSCTWHSGRTGEHQRIAKTRRELGNCRRLLSRTVRSDRPRGRALGDLTRRIGSVNSQLSESCGCGPRLFEHNADFPCSSRRTL